jgi:hypothetical protein
MLSTVVPQFKKTYRGCVNTESVIRGHASTACDVLFVTLLKGLSLLRNIKIKLMHVWAQWLIAASKRSTEAPH